MGHAVISPPEQPWITRPHAAGDPARHVTELTDVPAGSLAHVGTALQNANHGDVDLVVYAHGWPPEDERAEILESAV